MASTDKHNYLTDQWSSFVKSQKDFEEFLAASKDLALARQNAAAAEVRMAKSLKGLSTHLTSRLCLYLEPLSAAYESMAASHAEYCQLVSKEISERIEASIKPTESKRMVKDQKKMVALSQKKHDAAEKAKQVWQKQKKAKNSEKKKVKYDALFAETEGWLDTEINKVKYNNQSRYKVLGECLSQLHKGHTGFIGHCLDSYNGLPPAALDSKAARVPLTYEGETLESLDSVAVEENDLEGIPPPDTPPPEPTSTKVTEPPPVSSDDDDDDENTGEAEEDVPPPPPGGDDEIPPPPPPGVDDDDIPPPPL